MAINDPAAGTTIAGPEASPPVLSRTAIYCVLATVAAPGALMLLGVDLGSGKMPLDKSLDGAALTDSMFRGLNGAFTHTLLEWSAFCVAIFTACLAFAHFAIKRDLVTPVIALALVAAGCMDAFHTFAADRLIGAAAPNKDLIPFTWAICRLFNSVICMGGVAFFLLADKDAWGRHAGRVIAIAGVTFVGFAFAIISLCANSDALPQTQYPNALITRPWDVGPFLIFLASSALFVALYKKIPSIFAFALVLSTVPDLATQAHMALGSSALFDAHFNAAHFLKIIAYATPCVGLLADYVRVNREEHERVAKLASANEALRETSEHLQRSNEDLQQFAYVASHDLKAPLRAISNLADWIREDLEDPDSRADVHANLDRLSARSARMSALIDGILAYSRLEAVHTDVVEVDSRTILTDIQSVELPGDGAFELRMHGSFPTLFTNTILLRQVLANLVTNAIKHHDKNKGGISVSCEPAGGEFVQFSVTDDGPGIEPQYQERIFGIFQTLKARDEHESTGIGLSLVKKLVTNQGGTISVESDGVSGTTFRFTWPIGKATTEEKMAA